MAPGEFNGKNYGGLHSGCGKKQKTGIYSLNGYHHNILSHKYFKPGKEVLDIVSGYIGIIEEKKEGPRSLIKIYIPSIDKTKYIYTKFLKLKRKNIKSKIIEYKSYTEKETEKYNKYLEKKKEDTIKREKEKKEKKEHRLNMRKMKKLFREDINNNIIMTKNDYLLLKSNSNIVNEINKERYLRLKQLNKDKTFIKLNKLTQDGSSDQLCLNISNKNDYLNLVNEYYNL